MSINSAISAITIFPYRTTIAAFAKCSTCKRNCPFFNADKTVVFEQFGISCFAAIAAIATMTRLLGPPQIIGPPTSSTVTAFAAVTASTTIATLTVTNSNAVKFISKDAINRLARFSTVAAAFQNCEGITSITLPFIGTTSGDTSYTYFASVFGLTLPPSDYYVPDLLQTVIITGDVRIDASAFNQCSELTSVVLEGSVTEIGENAFRYCSKLTSITIGGGLTSIGNRAFQHCRLLTAIHFEGTTEEWLSLAKGTDWDTNTGSYTVYCTNGTLTK